MDQFKVGSRYKSVAHTATETGVAVVMTQVMEREGDRVLLAIAGCEFKSESQISAVVWGIVKIDDEDPEFPAECTEVKFGKYSALFFAE